MTAGSAAPLRMVTLVTVPSCADNGGSSSPPSGSEVPRRWLTIRAAPITTIAAARTVMNRRAFMMRDSRGPRSRLAPAAAPDQHEGARDADQDRCKGHIQKLEPRIEAVDVDIEAVLG